MTIVLTDTDEGGNYDVFIVTDKNNNDLVKYIKL